MYKCQCSIRLHFIWANVVIKSPKCHQNAIYLSWPGPVVIKRKVHIVTSLLYSLPLLLLLLSKVASYLLAPFFSVEILQSCLSFHDKRKKKPQFYLFEFVIAWLLCWTLRINGQQNCNIHTNVNKNSTASTTLW